MGWELRGGSELRKISLELRRAGDGKTVRKQLTSELRAVGRPIVPAVRASAMSIPTSGKGSTGLRKRIARATRLQVFTVGKRASVSILVDGRKMPPGEGALPAYMEGTKRPWRHPVFGNTDDWVSQKAHPYFYKVVAPLGHRSRSAVNRVLDNITKKIT